MKLIAKIFTHATSFVGINYNENKILDNKAELISQNNIPSIDENNIEFLNKYFEKYCQNKNIRVKKKQFHTLISTKGEYFDKEELKEFGEKYLKKMGYGNNPFLIYFHNDTKNNHIHLISTRVNNIGEKVNDKFEKLRSQSVLLELLNVDIKHNYNEDLKNNYNYHFSNENQFLLLMQLSGYNYKKDIEHKEIVFYKHGKEIGNISIKNIPIKKFKEDHKLAQFQLKAVLQKYAKYFRDTEKFNKFLKYNFNIEIIFFRGKDHTRPYGYSLIDHNNKIVFKGSSVLGLNQLIYYMTDHNKEVDKDLLAKVINSLPDFYSEDIEYEQLPKKKKNKKGISR